jgi:hypothetical protein
MEAASIPEIDAAAELYEQMRDKRMRAGVREVDAKVALIELMRKFKLDVYRDSNQDPPLVIELKEGKVSVKVERLEGEVEQDVDDDEDPAERASA